MISKIKFILAFILFLSFFINAEEIAVPYNVKSKFTGKVNVDKMFFENDIKKISIYFTADDSWINSFNRESLESMNRLFIHLINENRINFSSIKFMVKRRGESEYFNITSILPKSKPVPRKEYGYEKNKINFFKRAIKSNGREGFLKDKTIFVSAGHGWTNDSSSWGTQRSNTSIYNLVEDFSNAEIVNYYLIPYLKNAGAQIFTVREHDTNTNMVIIDNADYNTDPAKGVYEESGSWINTSGGKGFGHGSSPYSDGVNPFELGQYRYITGTEGARAFWIPNIPEEGQYEVYVSFKAGTDRAENAEYIVHHAGGSTSVFADQRHHGSTWYNLGKFPFHKGLNKSEGSVELVAESDSGKIFIADAVRFGGGMGITDHGIGTSEKPRWEEFSRHNIQFMGAPASTVYDGSGDERSDDVRARPRYAAWENEASYDDSLYISWHSNAYNGTTRGISTYIYGENAPGTGYTPDAAEGSESLGSYVHSSILETVKNGYDTAFKVYGIGLYSAYLGEIDPDENNEMPSVLVELAFHDNDTDAAMLREPLMRRLAARGAYHGIVKYFANRDSLPAVFLPDNVTALRTEVTEAGKITVFWEAPISANRIINGDTPSGYIVQKSRDGFGFDDGENVGNVNSWIFTPQNSSETWYFRIIAYNDGGKSFPSPVVTAKADSLTAKALIVDSFSKLDSDMAIMEPFPASSSSVLTPRMFLERMNTFNYIRKYGSVLSSNVSSFESVTLPALNDIDFSDYEIIVWYSGIENSFEGIFGNQLEALKNYIDNGGLLIITGSDVAETITSQNEISFLESYLGASFVSDNEDYSLNITNEFGFMNFTLENTSYFSNSGKNDILISSDKTIFITYSDETGAAVIQNGKYRTALLGFPFERITDTDSANKVMKTILDYEEIEQNDEDVIPDNDNSENDEDIPENDSEEISDNDTISDNDSFSDSETGDEDITKDYICEYNNTQYEAGDSFFKNDACNNICWCHDGGEISCSDNCNEKNKNDENSGCSCSFIK